VIAEASRCRWRAHRVLFVQATEPAGYPPLIHAATLMAESGWEVTFLTAPIAGSRLELPRHPRIAVRSIPPRPSHVMSKPAYARYNAAAAQFARSLRPDVVYASDPLGAGPGCLAAWLAGARLVYHEHDSPAPGALHPWLARRRAAAVRQATLVIFPNAARGQLAQADLGFPPDRLRIVWNLPCRAELPALSPADSGPLVLYYHGNISPHLLPETVVAAARRYGGAVTLRIAGREAPGAPGYLKRLLDRGTMPSGRQLVTYSGQVPRHDLLAEAARADIGLALMPRDSMDLNIRHMIGASNKVFDYMAASLALLVSDQADWHGVFVLPGYARACNPADPGSISDALGWFLDHAEERRAMAARGRAKIETEWNYDAAFVPVIADLSDCVRD
jgi:glycosyltransferase involved in cell wall biosynthesis